jgi:hypothetical protein
MIPFTYNTTALTKESSIITSVAKDIEKLEPSNTADRDINVTIPVENSLIVPHRVTIVPRNSILSMHPKKPKRFPHKNLYINIYNNVTHISTKMPTSQMSIS